MGWVWWPNSLGFTMLLQGTLLPPSGLIPGIPIRCSVPWRLFWHPASTTSSPPRPRCRSCLLPMALAFVHLGLPELATRELDHATCLPNVTDEAKLILKYHAAVIHLAQGNTQQAAQLFQEVGESSPGFRDTEELLSKCRSQGSKIAKL